VQPHFVTIIATTASKLKYFKIERLATASDCTT